jgi:serine/threonine-protein kinase haspin
MAVGLVVVAWPNSLASPKLERAQTEQTLAFTTCTSTSHITHGPNIHSGLDSRSKMPRIVYGKKAAPRPADITFTKFIAPEKDELADLEAQLGGLKIAQTGNVEKEKSAVEEGAKEGEHKKKRKERKALEARDANTVAKEAQADETIKAKAANTDEKPTPLAEPTPPATPVRRKPKSKSKKRKSTLKAQLPTPEPTPEPEDVYSAYVSPLVPLSYGRKIMTFDQWSLELDPHFEVTKIAEASFSEVYRLSATSPATGIKEESVLKLVALKTPPDAPLPSQTHERAVRDRESQVEKEMAERDEKDKFKSHVADVLSEVKLLQNLNDIPGFTNFRDLMVLQGRPSTSFNNAWKSWNKARPRGKKSYFPDPSKKASYEDTQLWAVIEMGDAGMDVEKLMEAGGLSTIWEIWDVFWGVCLGVAKAEEACKFEHRDLHLGNICVRSSRGTGVMDPTIKDPLRRKFRFSGLETTVIDYTLSRADIVAAPDTEPTVAFLDLDKDPAIFEGDAAEEYQYEIYRYMRGAALFNNPLQSASAPTSTPTPASDPEPEPEAIPEPASRQNTHIRFDSDAPSPAPSIPTSTPACPWTSFHPLTNLVWAHFLLHKLLAHLARHPPSSLTTEQCMENVVCIDETLAPALKVKKKAEKLHGILVSVSELLCPVALGREEALGSVKELVVLALEERWLRVGDVAG